MCLIYLTIKWKKVNLVRDCYISQRKNYIFLWVRCHFVSLILLEMSVTLNPKLHWISIGRIKITLRTTLKLKLHWISINNNNSLKTLLDSATPTPRFFKREKRRKLRSDQPPQQPNKENETETQGSPNKKTKRKKLEDDDVAATGVSDTPKKKKNPRTAKENESNGGGEMPEATELTKTNTTTR